MIRVFSACAAAVLVAGLSACSASSGVTTPATSTPEYKGSDLAQDVKRTLTDDDDRSVSGVTCDDTAKVKKGGITDCTAIVDGDKTGIRVTWDDNEGHFTLSEQAL